MQVLPKPALKCLCRQNQSVILRDSSGGWGSFSIQSWIRNYVVHIDITPLRRKEIMTICFAFLISVLELSMVWVLCLPTLPRQKITLTFNNSQMTTKPASNNFFCKTWILFHSDSFRCPFVKGTAPDFGMRHFPGATWLPPLAAGWWKLNWTVLLFTMRKSKPFPLDMVKERCEQLTEIILWPGRSQQVLISSCEQ